MTNEERTLLMTDLCGRIPYGVHVLAKLDLSYDREFDEVYQVCEFEAELEGVNTDDSVALTIFHKDQDSSDYLNQYVQTCPCTLDDIKPYLRPMSDMTDEEIDKMWEVYENNPAAEGSSKITDLLNKWGLDHHHLIEKGLAKEAPEGMYEID